MDQLGLTPVLDVGTEELRSQCYLSGKDKDGAGQVIAFKDQGRLGTATSYTLGLYKAVLTYP